MTTAQPLPPRPEAAAPQPARPRRPAPEIPGPRPDALAAKAVVPATATARAAATLSEQLAHSIALQISQGTLVAGARLLSVRQCALRHGLSTSTVVAAYDLLQARGLVQAFPQRGTFVRADAPSEPRTTGASPPRPAPAPLPAPVDAKALIRSMFQVQGGKASPGMGTLPESWLDAAPLQRALRQVCSRSTDWLRYGEPAGDTRLRQALARRLQDLGIGAAPEQLVTTTGATHALDLVCRSLLQPGDAVLVDNPGWATEFARLAHQGMHLLPVPRGEHGPDLAVMAALLQQHRPRLYVTVSVLHNPTGASLSPAAAHQVLRLAETHDLTIVEDDTYAWLAPPHATRLAQLDGLQRTIYVSGFSKILTPQWRVGYLAAPAALVSRITDTKLLTTLTTPAPLEQAVALCLEQGQLRRHAERVATRLTAARSRTARLVREAGCRFVTPPAGLFGWVDVGADTEALAPRLLEEGWLTAPGALFHAQRQPGTLMRVNFATAQDPRFWQRVVELRV
jgi:DNA-binding transcriptional MocR family regulator